MSVNDSEPRRLTFPLYYSQSPLVTGGDLTSPSSVTPEWQTTDNDEIVTITLTVSLNEFVALASAIDAGRDLAYGDKSIELWQIWIKAVNTLSLCQQIADCIESSQAVKDALTEFVRDDLPQDSGNTGTGLKLPDETLLQNMVNGCDNDNLYAATTQLVDFVNVGIVDFLQIVEEGTGRLERMNVAVSAIPIIGILPVDEALLFLDQIIQNFMDNYVAQYTQEIRDEYACELFCIAKPNCELTFKDMADYFSGKAGATFDAITLAEALDWFIFGTWSGDLIVHGMHALFCWAIVWGSEFFGVNLNRIVRIVQAASNDSDPDWEIECDDCPEPEPIPPCVEWNNLVGDGWSISLQNLGTADVLVAPVIDNTFGNPQPSAKAGFIDNNAGLFGRDLSIRISFDTPQRVTSAAMQFWYNDTGNNAARRRIQLLDATDAVIAQNDVSTNDATKSQWNNHTWSGDVEGVYHITFLIRHLSASFTEETTSAWLDNICIETEPMTFDDFFPVVAWENEFCEDGHGTNIIDLGGGYWQMTAVENPKNASAIGVSFKDVLGREFVVDDINFTSSTGMYYGANYTANSCRQETFNFFSSPPLELIECNMGRSIALGTFDVTFRAVLA